MRGVCGDVPRADGQGGGAPAHRRSKGSERPGGRCAVADRRLRRHVVAWEQPASVSADPQAQRLLRSRRISLIRRSRCALRGAVSGSLGEVPLKRVQLG